MSAVIDIHSHFLAASLVRALERRRELPRITGGPGARLIEYGSGNVHPLLPEMGDINLRMQHMNEHGIDVAVISVNIPGVDWFPATDGPSIARDVNDELSALVAAHDSRLAALATLPMQVPEAAAAELTRAMATGFCGAMIYSNVAGGALDDPRLRVVFDTAAELDAPLFIHPTFPLTASTVDAYALIPTLGFMFDTTTAAARLVLDGLYERHPGFSLVLAHAASLLPQLAGRIDYEAERHEHGRGAVSVDPSEHLRLIYTDSVCAWAPALRNTIELVGSERVMLGTDYPFWDPARTFDTIAGAKLSDEVTDAIREGNARRLFGLPRLR
ncbi:MAG: amidohydrolase [Actinomycetota bacterium]|nr:amidohydrolase [Actinomycetota bacterium]